MSGISGPPACHGALDDALDAGLADIVRRTGASSGALYLIEEEESATRLVALCGLPLEFAAPWHRLSLTASLPLTDAIREDHFVWVGCQDDLACRYPRLAAVLPYRFACAATPLTGVRRCWGGIILMWPADLPREATPRERCRIISSARRLARLLDDAPRPSTLPDRPRLIPVSAPGGSAQPGLAAAEYLERLPEGALSLDLEGRITFVTATAGHLLGRSVNRLLGCRLWQALPWLDDPVYEDRYRTAVFSRAPLSFTAIRPPEHRLRFRLYPDVSGISVRITSRREQTLPGPREAPVYRAPVARTGRLYQLIHLSAALTETVSVRDLVDLIAGEILPAFGAQGLALWAAEAGRLKVSGFHGHPADVIARFDGLPLDADLTPVGQVLTSGVPEFSASPTEMAARYPETPQIGGKQAWAFLPLIITGRVVGCCVLSYDRPHPFTADERAVMTALAGLIAQALDRARMYDAQHHLAHGLQKALLPRDLPAVAGLDVAARYLPASHGIEVGGDFYDLLRLDDTSAAAVIGDVEGHSIAAAALMGQVRTAIHAHVTAGAPPDQILARTNRLLADLDSDLLVSCLYAHLDLAACEITFASAGHVPPLLRIARHHARVLDDIEPGPLLGIDTLAHYPVTTVSLPADATLVLYTDGLVEVAGTDTAQITAGLVGHFASTDDEDLEDLIDGLIHHTWPMGQHTDDIAVLLLRASCTQP
ncbi:SpoIIE family protein phosphatase [Streptomyces hyaluromycini]|uniref:SpoIIE family protein phosphatase n=1 Tax=Streptomyces hyaluromycini TaxID=1377993 RepID=UPI000B5C3D44|nr:SpoIIE family protein phosphatase [Streptomyces hyaluromycini]